VGIILLIVKIIKSWTVIPLIQDKIATALLAVTQTPTFSWSWNGGVMGDLVLVEEHLLRALSRAGVLFERRLLLEEDPLDLVQSFLRAITLMTLLGALVGWFWLGRLFAQRVNKEAEDCVTTVGITRLPQLPFQSSLVRQSIFLPKTLMASYPTNIRTFNLSMWETWIT
jgi:hypothetical protein